MPSNAVGYLLPNDAPAPLEDDAFENFLHDLFAGITGMANELVRPRWQPEPPNQPARELNWLAFGIMDIDADTYAVTEHDPATIGPNPPGSDSLQRHETVEVLISSYGPNSMKNLAVLRDGLQIEQNRAVLTANGMGLTNTGRINPAPSLVKEKWLKRFDMLMVFRRQVRRVYSVYNLASAVGTLNTEALTTNINVSE